MIGLNTSWEVDKTGARPGIRTMKVVQVNTLRLDEFPNILFLQIHTDEGLTGLGETFFGARAVEAYVHETVAPYLLGKEIGRASCRERV
jgi:galactonate dehydratase